MPIHPSDAKEQLKLFHLIKVLMPDGIKSISIFFCVCVVCENSLNKFVSDKLFKICTIVIATS